MTKLYSTDLYSSKPHRFTACLNKVFAKEQVRFVRKYQPNGKLLDFGCGAGWFLAEAAVAGFDVQGIEPHQAISSALPRALRAKVHTRALIGGAYPEAEFDVISLFNVLEHLEQPLQVVQELTRLLKPSGIMVIEVPNLCSREAKWLGRFWYNLDVPYHFWHFTPESLAGLVSKAGLKIKVTETSALNRPAWLFNYLMLASSSITKKYSESFPAFGRHESLGKILTVPLVAMTRLFWSGNCPLFRVVLSQNDSFKP